MVYIFFFFFFNKANCVGELVGVSMVLLRFTSYYYLYIYKHLFISYI